jgi:hypothetical protein
MPARSVVLTPRWLPPRWLPLRWLLVVVIGAGVVAMHTLMSAGGGSGRDPMAGSMGDGGGHGSMSPVLMGAGGGQVSMGAVSTSQVSMGAVSASQVSIGAAPMGPVSASQVSASAVSMGAAPMSDATPAAATAAVAAGAPVGAPPAGHPGHPGGGSMSMLAHLCLAVLTLLLFAFAAPLLLARSRRVLDTATRPAGDPTRSSHPRAPPPTSVRLAELCVSRR